MITVPQIYYFVLGEVFTENALYTLHNNSFNHIIDFTGQGKVKLVPDVLKKLIDQKKGAQYGQILFFPGTL